MRISFAGLDLIKQSEGFRGHTYLDVAGLPTIGYGHLLLPHESYPNGMTETQGSALLAQDVQLAEHAVARLVKVPLTQGQFDALTDFCFNLGEGKLASSTLLKILNAGEYGKAHEQLLRWDVAAGKENAGLKTRRQAEFELWGNTVSPQEGAVRTLNS